MIHVIGDIGLDVYSYQKIKGMSNEFPVTVLESPPERVEVSAGMAGNVAHAVSDLGEEVELYGQIGAAEAEVYGKIFADTKVKLLADKIDGHGTVKKRFLTPDHQHVMREDRDIKAKDITLPKNPDIVVVSDYGKGVITDARMLTLIQNAKAILVDVDPNKNLETYSGVDLIKLNLREAQTMTGMLKEIDVAALADVVLDKSMAGAVVITLGAAGLYYQTPYDEGIRLDGIRAQVVDVCGAGDAVLASLAVSMQGGEDIEDALKKANALGAKVVSIQGTCGGGVENA